MKMIRERSRLDLVAGITTSDTVMNLTLRAIDRTWGLKSYVLSTDITYFVVFLPPKIDALKASPLPIYFYPLHLLGV